ncbi:MAG TPA: hypothetical protein VNQ73_18995 [Ilumatobacter sp.]|nr:hypothetical protein [Ilumatobacter sp.]
MTAAEAAATGVAGAVLGGAAASLVGLAVPGALAAGASGALAGWRGIYQWRAPKGVAAFVLDSTWALPTTAAGLFAHAAAAVRGDAQYSPELSRRRNRHVYGRGFQPRKGFAITLGNVVSGAGDVANPRRARLVTDHEDVHVWQARWLGPAYPLAYGGFAAGGAVVGAVAAALGKGRFAKLVETYGYYLNPLEYWAYSRDGHWPPSGIAPGIGPQRPVVRAFAGTTRGSSR